MNTNLSGDAKRLSFKKAITEQEVIEKLISVKQYIDVKYASPITIAELGRHAAINAFYMIRLFKAYFDTTPHQYLTIRRMKEAYELLRESKTVTEVCKAVGYADIASFSKLFRKIHGIPPSEVKKNLQVQVTTSLRCHLEFQTNNKFQLLNGPPLQRGRLKVFV